MLTIYHIENILLVSWCYERKFKGLICKKLEEKNIIIEYNSFRSRIFFIFFSLK